MKVQNADVEVTCRVQRYNTEILANAILGARVVVNGLTSLHSFATGYPLTVTFDAGQAPGETRKQLELTNPHLGALCTAYSTGNVGSVWELVLQDFKLLQIFSDAALALSLPLYQPISCGRVLDGIRNYIAPTLDARKGWQAVRNELNVSQPFLEYVTERAKKPRHREPDQLDSVQIGICLRNTWSVANRLLEYCKRGKTRLAAPEFELLR